MCFWLELESNATFRFGRVQRNTARQLHYAHDVSSLCVSGPYVCLKCSPFLSFPKYKLKKLYYRFVFCLYQLRVEKLNLVPTILKYVCHRKPYIDEKVLKDITHDIILGNWLLSLTPFKNEELLLVFISLTGSKMMETSARTG